MGKQLSSRGLASDARGPGFNFQYWEVGNTKKTWLRSLSSPETSSIVARVRTYGEKRPQTLKGLTPCCLVRTDCLSAFPRGPWSSERQNSHKHRGLGGQCAVGKHTWWGLWGPRLFAMCVLSLISKDSSEEAEALQSLNKPHGHPWTVRPDCHVMTEKGYYQPEEREHGLLAVLPTTVTEQLAPVREERSNFDSWVLWC